jgi:Cys-tRNA(Pro)/Cys-tRNA(Cys) deacylase
MIKNKTNVMRILDSKNITYKVHVYDSKDGKIDGISVAQKINKDPKCVYKTLVAQGNSNNLYIFIIPVMKELNLKKAAKVTGEKKIEMIATKNILKYTGYVRGGCSPIGMKKQYKTYIDNCASVQNEIVVSAGKIGSQIEISIDDLVALVNAEIADIT